MKSVKELVAEANSRVKTVTVHEALLLGNDPDTVFVDLRPCPIKTQGSRPGTRSFSIVRVVDDQR
jgi:hypothetical protein